MGALWLFHIVFFRFFPLPTAFNLSTEHNTLRWIPGSPKSKCFAPGDAHHKALQVFGSVLQYVEVSSIPGNILAEQDSSGVRCWLELCESLQGKLICWRPLWPEIHVIRARRQAYILAILI